MITPKIRRRPSTERGPVIGMIYGKKPRYMWVVFGTNTWIGAQCRLTGVLADAVADKGDCSSVTNAPRGSCGWVELP